MGGSSVGSAASSRAGDWVAGCVRTSLTRASRVNSGVASPSISPDAGRAGSDDLGAMLAMVRGEPETDMLIY